MTGHGPRSPATRRSSSTSCSAVVAAAVIGAYAAYALTAHDSRWLLATVPFVVYGLFRYLLLLHRRGLGEEPGMLLVEDATA